MYLIKTYDKLPTNVGQNNLDKSETAKWLPRKLKNFIPNV